MDIDYYKQCTIHIHTKNIRDHLPPQQHLRRFLRDFGRISGFYEWPFGDKSTTGGEPNSALVLFESPDVVQEILKDSYSTATGSFWITQSLTAYPLRLRYEHIFDRHIKPIGAKGTTERHSAPQGGSKPTPRKPWSERQSPGPSIPRPRPSLAEDEPPSKRPRNETSTSAPVPPPPPEPWPAPNGASTATAIASQPTPPKIIKSSSPRTPSATPESTEWMRSRIAHLESELEFTKAARDMAVSEQNVVLIAHEAEKQARREALTQKSAAEAAQSRAEAEKARLLAELENPQPSKDVEHLRVQLVGVEADLQDSLTKSTKASERIKALEAELEDAMDRAHKLQIQKSDMERELKEARSSAAQLDESAKMIEKLKAELGSAEEKLESTQRSLETMQRKCSTRRQKHEATRVKLGTYKEQLESQRAIVKTLRETLTPAAYKTLGATHQTLGAFLSAMGLPPMDDQEPKEESD